MDASDRPRAVPRSYKSKRHRDRTRPPSENVPRYSSSSSSDGEDGTVSCEQCEQCDSKLAACSPLQDGGRPAPRAKHQPPSPQCNGMDLPLGGTRGLGLSPDEKHISPIESYNPSNTISRLYSYLSASEGEGDGDAGAPRGKYARPGDDWTSGDQCTAPPSESSVSVSSQSDDVCTPSNCAASDNDVDELEARVRGRPVDASTLGSSGGENLYSRINETSTLPMPPVPPPPDSLPGPAVPPRINLQMFIGVPSEQPSRRSAAYHDLEEDFEPQFLHQTPSGTIYIPQGPGQSSPTVSSPPAPFPRTVPRTSSLPRHGYGHQPQVALASTPSSLYATNHRPGAVPNHNVVPPPPPPPLNHETQRVQASVPESNSTDRQNVAFNPNATLLPTLPTYPSVQNDFRDYNRFSNATFRVKKHFKSRCSWKLAAFVLLLVCVALSAVVAYFLAMKVYDLNWHLQEHTDLNNTAPDWGKQPNIGADSDSVIEQYPLGTPLVQTIPAHSYLRTQLYLPESQTVHYNVTVPAYGVVGVYGRRNVQPSPVQYDFFHLVNGRVLANSNDRYRRQSKESPVTRFYSSAFIHHMEEGLWYVFLYNDNDTPQKVTLLGKKHTKAMTDCPKDCLGRGDCVNGQCRCEAGYQGWACSESVCPEVCQGNGIYVRGECQCYPGWKGKECHIPEHQCEDPTCSGNGKCIDGRCVCSPGYAGDKCDQEMCQLECIHGTCHNQRCRCADGWSGAQCNVIGCEKRCYVHGHCDNGTCICKQGWNGKHCSLSGCPNACNSHGLCQLFLDGWRCNCREGWKGPACNVAMEMECDNDEDDDKDGLTDCEDPDCCISIACKDAYHCVTAPDPMEILLRKQPPSSTASFYDRMRFLVEDESVQSYATLTSFNQSQVSVIRGKVLSGDRSPLIGVRVDVVTQPLYGFTLTREQGLFDILVNGGGSVTLQFKRQPFQERHVTVMVPWNHMVTMETVTLTLPGEKLPETGSCEHVRHDHYRMKPIVLSTWQHTQLGACPSKSTIIPESQVLQESVQIPGTDVYLVYHSSETPGYMSTIMIQLTPSSIPEELAEVHLRVSVEGLTFEKLFEADPGLKYKFAWDRRNAYNQKVYGIVSASVGVGYKYTNCSQIIWETQSATMSGYDITSSEIGGWNLHIHHTYNFQEGILHKGDGTNIYLKERPRKVITVMGDGRKRKSACRNCDGKAMDSRLLAPVALASGRDGSLYVGDYNHIRKLSANREDVTSILEMDLSETSYKYFMTVSPLDAKLYISDYMSRTILRVKTMGAVRDLQQNYEIIAGTGEQCMPGDAMKCGDGGPAVKAKLYRPKGIAINKDGIIYIVDGVNIRVIDKSNTINTLIGSQGQPTYWKPLPCNKVVSTKEAKLQWPTAVAINPLDDTLHILDDGMVLKVTKDNKVLMVAGRPLHCPPKNLSRSSLLTEEQAGPQLATDVLLKSPQHIAFAPNGDLYVVESDGKSINQVRVVSTDGSASHYAGGKSRCDCSVADCRCYSPGELLATEMLLSDPTAITVTPDNVLHIADQGHLRVHSIIATLPDPDRYGQYEVLYPQTQELYVFNRYGQHVATRNIVTDQYVYNFTYNVNSYYGKLVKVTDSGGNQLTVTRDYTTQAKEIIPPGGQKCKFTMDNMGQLHVFVAADNATMKFTYLSNTGLLETKETSEGYTFLYEFDENGRLSSIVQPTGERTLVNTDVDPSDNSVSKVSYLHDGSLIVQYPFNMAITLETSPHPLLSTDQPLHVKRKVILPDNVVHKLEWRYYVRRDRAGDSRRLVRKIGRRMRVGNTDMHAGGRLRTQGELSLHASSGYDGKVLMINGENLLTLEYDRATNTETVLRHDGEEMFIIQYNSAGQIIHVLPNPPLQGLNVTYNDRGHMTGWHHGDMSIVNVYDKKLGHLVERRLSGRAVYRFIYKTGNKPSDVILPSGKQYVFHYDSYGNLKAAVMPSLGKHHFHSLTTLGVHRRMYQPPGAHGKYIKDYDSNGHLMQVLYPSEHRRITYSYTSFGQLKGVVFDWSDIRYEYYPSTQMVRSVQLFNPVPFKYNCTVVYEAGDALIRSQVVEFRGEDLRFLGARFHYQYDNHFRVAVLEATIGSRHFGPYNKTYNATTGRLSRLKDFTFEYPDVGRQVARDGNVEVRQELDGLGRRTDAFYRFNNYVGCTVEVKYDSLDRVYLWRRKVGSSDLKSYEYVYDIDGNVVEVLVNGQSTWTYETDANSNVVRMTHHRQVKTVEIDARNQVEASAGRSYTFDGDGFLARRDREAFEYNSAGQLVRAFETGKYDVYYFYDAAGRLVARKDALGGYTTQFFYGDVERAARPTHVYEHATGTASAFLYDAGGRLLAMERDGGVYYVVSDPVGSPILVLNAVGSVIKQMAYDPLGRLMSDSAPDFRFPFGYRSGIADHITGLIFVGGRVYDPNTGRHTAPDYDGLLDSIQTIMDHPENLNTYRHPLISPNSLQDKLKTDLVSWLEMMGYDMKSLMQPVGFSGHIQSKRAATTSDRCLIPVTSAFQCAFERDMENFVELSSVPRSKVASRHDRRDSDVIKAFSPFPFIFGAGVVLSSRAGLVVVDVLDSADGELAELATVLLNNSAVVRPSYTIHGRDVHYFVKRTLSEAVDDVKALSLRAEDVVRGVNVTVHRHHDTPEVMRYVDIRLHGNHTVLNLRYGTDVVEERRRVLTHAVQRAVESAWKVERELVQSNKQTVNVWSRAEREELLSRGRVSGYEGRSIRDVERHPELADDPKNIRFVRSAR